MVNRLLVLSGCMILCLLLPASSVKAADLPDALRYTANLYANLHSYAERATVEATLQTGSTTLERFVEGIVLSAKRPNLLRLVINVPNRAAYQAVYSDGKTLSVYNSSTNQYFASPTAPTFLQLLPLLHKKAQINFVPSPLYLFADPSLLSSFRDFKQEAEQTIEGHTCRVLSALAPPAPSPLGRQTVSVRWKWYIDKHTGWIWRLEGVSEPALLRVRLPGHPQPEPTKVILRIEYRILQEQIDPEIPQGDFRFHPPRGATPKKGSTAPQALQRSPK
jgi:outer membrane lipoprotein-sorting protein